jgi:hypothetical protein
LFNKSCWFKTDILSERRIMRGKWARRTGRNIWTRLKLHKAFGPWSQKQETTNKKQERSNRNHAWWIRNHEWWMSNEEEDRTKEEG